MSNSEKKVTETSSSDNVSDRLRDSLSFDVNKPDYIDPNLLKTPGFPLKSALSAGLGNSTSSSSSGFTTTTSSSSSSSSSESVSVSGSGTGTTGSGGSGRGRSNVRVKKVNFEETVRSYSPSGLSESSPISTRSTSRSKTRVKSNQQARSGTSGSQPQQPMKNGTGGSVNSPSTPKSGTGSMKSPPSPSSSKSSSGGSVRSPCAPFWFSHSQQPMKSGTGGSDKSPSTPKSSNGSMKSPPSPSSSKSGTGGSVKSPSSSSTSKSGTGGSVKSSSSPSTSKSGTGGSVKSPSPSPPTSPRIKLPAGNICPHGIVKTGMASNSKKTDKLGPGTGSYGHGSLMRAGAVTKTTVKLAAIARGTDPEELKRLGNEDYNQGNYVDALRCYDRAISLLPINASYRGNRAAALMSLGRLPEALKECQEAVKLDPAHGKAQQRIGAILFRFGRVEDARKHLRMAGQKATPEQIAQWTAIDKHLTGCVNGRKIGAWKNVLKECDSAIAVGADHCPELFTCRAEALLKLHQLDNAVDVFSQVPKFDLSSLSSSAAPRFGMLFEAYYLLVKAQLDLAFGRFETAITTAERAGQVDPLSTDIVTFLKNARLILKARSRGNELFKSERITEASYAYEEGLKLDPSNAVLYCNRAACSFKIGKWETSIEDCNQALKIQPKYAKALLRRAASSSKLERWADAVRDYEILRKEVPDDNEVAKSLFRAQVALKKSRGEEVSNVKFGGEVEEVSTPDQFKAAISWSGVTVVHFKAQFHPLCEQISPFFDTLCKRYPFVSFIMVDIEASPSIASLENVGIVPTFKIFRNGKVVKEMICPNQHSLETSVRHYST